MDLAAELSREATLEKPGTKALRLGNRTGGPFASVQSSRRRQPSPHVSTSQITVTRPDCTENAPYIGMAASLKGVPQER